MANAPPKAASTVAREAFFLDFAKAIREKFRSVPLMVTGGFRTRQGMEAALREDACDIIGLGICPQTRSSTRKLPTRMRQCTRAMSLAAGCSKSSASRA